MLGPNGETIAPGAFLPVAESYGLIGEIDRWVLRQACQIVADGRAGRSQRVGRHGG